MNIKRIWLVIPTILLPYLVLFALATLFLSSEIALFEIIMEKVFNNNALYLMASVLLCFLFAIVLNLIFFVLGITKGWDALSLAKSSMIIKLIQAPAYVLIFGLGALLMITVFTFPFSFALIFFDCITLVLTGLITTAAAVNSSRNGVFNSKEVALIIISQLVFCLDVVAAIVFYLNLKKRLSANVQTAETV